MPSFITDPAENVGRDVTEGVTFMQELEAFHAIASSRRTGSRKAGTL